MIKSVISETKQPEETEYPCLMRSNAYGYIVAFEEKGDGTVLSVGDSHYKIFEKCKKFEMECFTPFNGSITLSNEDS